MRHTFSEMAPLKSVSLLPQEHRGRHRSYVSILSDSLVTRGVGNFATLSALYASHSGPLSEGLHTENVNLCPAEERELNDGVIDSEII